MLGALQHSSFCGGIKVESNQLRCNSAIACVASLPVLLMCKLFTCRHESEDTRDHEDPTCSEHGMV